MLCDGRNFNKARNFLFSIPKKSNGAVKLEDKHFNALIRAFGEAGLFGESLKVFKTMKSMGVSPSIITFNHLFLMLLKRGRTGVVFELYDEMLKTYGVKPDLYSFNILIRGFCKSSMVDEGFKFFKEMEKFQCKPDVITYNTIVDGLCRVGKVKIAHNLMKGMLKKESSLSPNVVTYTTLIRGFCEKQDIESALCVLQEMAHQGLKPNEITYNTLMQGLCASQKLGKMKDVLQKCCQENGGFVPDTCTFNTLINAHCAEGNLVEGMNIFNNMLELKVLPDSATYSILIRSCSEKGDFEKAEELVGELIQKEILLSDDGRTPIVASYNPIFKYLCETGKTEKADRLFRALMRRGTQDAPAFKTLILGHCREGTAKAGHELLVAMLRRDFLPDVETYESLIEGLLKINDPITAHDTLEKLLNSSHLPKTSTFHHILVELVRNGNAHESASLMKLMLEKKVRQNFHISTDAVKLMIKVGLQNEALDMVRCLYENGFTIDMEQLIVSLWQQKKLLDACQFLLFAAKNGQKISLDVCSSLVIDLCSNHRVSEAFEVYFNLLEQGVQQQLSCLEDLRVALEANGRSKEAEFVSKRMHNQFAQNVFATN